MLEERRKKAVLMVIEDKPKTEVARTVGASLIPIKS